MRSESKIETTRPRACRSSLLSELRSARWSETRTNWRVQRADSSEVNLFTEKRTDRPKPLISGKMILKSREYSFNGNRLRSMNCPPKAAVSQDKAVNLMKINCQMLANLMRSMNWRAAGSGVSGRYSPMPRKRFAPCRRGLAPRLWQGW